MVEYLFGSKTRLKLLRLFFKDVDRSFYVRQLTRLVSAQINAVRRELERLTKAGIVEEVEGTPEAGTRGGRQRYYALNKECLLYTEIKALLAKSQLIEENSYLEEIKEKGGAFSHFVLTGCLMNNPSAPTDMLLVGSVHEPRLRRLVGRFEKELGQSIRYTVMSAREFNERKQLMDKFLYQIFEGPNLELIKAK